MAEDGTCVHFYECTVLTVTMRSVFGHDRVAGRLEWLMGLVKASSQLEELELEAISSPPMTLVPSRTQIMSLGLGEPLCWSMSSVSRRLLKSR